MTEESLIVKSPSISTGIRRSGLSALELVIAEEGRDRVDCVGDFLEVEAASTLRT